MMIKMHGPSKANCSIQWIGATIDQLIWHQVEPFCCKFPDRLDDVIDVRRKDDLVRREVFIEARVDAVVTFGLLRKLPE